MPRRDGEFIFPTMLLRHFLSSLLVSVELQTKQREVTFLIPPRPSSFFSVHLFGTYQSWNQPCVDWVNPKCTLKLVELFTTWYSSFLYRFNVENKLSSFCMLWIESDLTQTLTLSYSSCPLPLGCLPAVALWDCTGWGKKERTSVWPHPDSCALFVSYIGSLLKNNWTDSLWPSQRAEYFTM